MELVPGRVKTVLQRYKQIEQTISDPRYNNWDKWPTVNVKLKLAQMNSFIKFQKQLGSKG